MTTARLFYAGALCQADLGGTKTYTSMENNIFQEF
jgi:hypothetical protein